MLGKRARPVREGVVGSGPVRHPTRRPTSLVGRFAKAGGGLAPVRAPRPGVHPRLPRPADGKAIPYGVYDVADDSAWVIVGVDHDTAVFAVATIERWWEQSAATNTPTPPPC